MIDREDHTSPYFYSWSSRDVRAACAFSQIVRGRPLDSGFPRCHHSWPWLLRKATRENPFQDIFKIDSPMLSHMPFWLFYDVFCIDLVNQTMYSQLIYIHNINKSSANNNNESSITAGLTFELVGLNYCFSKHPYHHR